MTIRIRPATTTDINALIILENNCFSTDQLAYRQFYYFIKQSQSAKILVAIEKKQLMGYCILQLRRHSQLARIYSIAVHPDYRCQGLANLLLNKLEKLARQNDRFCIRLEVRKNNKKAIRFYLRQQYEVFGEYPRYYQDGMNALRMRKISG